MAIYNTNWLSTDFINFGDWNRIESNVADLASYLQSIQYNVPTPSVVTNRTVTSIDFLQSINRIENNLDAIQASFGMVPPSYLAKKTWAVGIGFSNTDANRLENNTQILKTYGQLVVTSYRYSGMATCGETGVIY